MGTVTQPPETQNVFLCLSVVVGLIWVINSTRRCWAVAQLRRALGSRRLVAIRGAGRRVRIFRLLGRSYLQRALGRNHLQALVHTRQAYPPKDMPCSLLLASDPDPSGGLKAILHPRETAVGDDSASPPPPPLSSVETPDGAVGSGVDEAGALIGVSMKLDCRVDCTVELLWDVDLTLLGREMGLHPKLHLLPASTGADAGRTRANLGGGDGASSRNLTRATAASGSAADLSNSSRAGGRGRSPRRRSPASFSSFTSGVWTSMVGASRRLARGGRERWGRRVSGVPPDSSAVSASVWDGRGSGSGGVGSGGIDNGIGGSGGGYIPNDRNGTTYDAEMGERGDGLGGPAAAATGGGIIDTGAPSARRGGGSGRVGDGGGLSWVATLGRRKSSAPGGPAEEGGEGGGYDGPPGLGAPPTSGHSSWRSRRGRGLPGAGMGLCGKRTVPRALSAGGGRVFETLPGESYFRGRQQSGAWTRGLPPPAGEGRGVRQDGDAISGVGSGGSASATAVGGGAPGALLGAEGGGGRGRWPKVEDSVRAGRCSLAVVIRPAAGADRGGWAGWRHRPTHRVVRQVFLVQLAERSGAAGGGASASSQQRPPSARCLRHLVAISKGGDGDSEAVYSFSEVFGASDEARGAGQTAPVSTSVFGSVQATAGCGSSSTVDAGSNANHNNNPSGAGNQPAASPQQQALPVSGGGGDDVPEECVICLTDPKDTLLLPCRHLCVCTECFRHVDKCPVCRSAFDNYIVLAGPQREEQQQPPAAGGGLVPAGGAVSATGAVTGGEGGAGGASAASVLGRTAAVFPLAGQAGAGNPSQQQQQQRQRRPTVMGSYSASLATAAASILPTFSMPGRGEGRRGRGLSRDDIGSDGIGVEAGFPSSPPGAAAVAGASSAVPARRNIFAVSRRRVADV